MYNNILVGFDGSEYSKAAVIESSHWIRRHGGRLILVHAVDFDEEETAVTQEQKEKRLDIGKNICLQSRETAIVEFGIEAESIVCEGDPSEIIIDIAQEKDSDLIALGTHGRRGLKKLLMGSVTSKVIVNSPCDVLVVKKSCSECTGKYESILAPFDGSEFSKRALNKACLLSKNDDAVVTVLYVMPRYEEMIGFFRTKAIERSMIEEANKMLGSAQELASKHGITLKTEIADGHADDMIVQTAIRLENDLIVIGSYGWKGISKLIMGGTTERVIMNATCPVLAVRC